MTVPFPNVSSGDKDNFNFYHSQLRINIECAFGILTNRWRIFKKPLHLHSISKTIALVFALCKLHNFCLDEVENKSTTVPLRLDEDPMYLDDVINNNDSEDKGPMALLHGSQHFNDISSGYCGACSYIAHHGMQEKLIIPWERMLQQVINGNWK